MIFAAGSILLIIIDQVIKYLTVNIIGLYEEIPVIKGIFSLTYIQNTGAAWGILAGNNWLLTIFTVLILVALTVYIVKKRCKSILFNSSVMLIYAGAIGNLIDRIFRNGAVVDMIEVKFISFPVFNFADCCIVVGAVLLCVYILFFTENSGERKNGKY